MTSPSDSPALGKVLMVQGTSSHVGKSVLVTALCRIFRQDGFKVAPFKSQNMSNNSFVSPTGGELGRAQAVQAEAAGVDPTVEMNPILLKPEGDNRSQVVVMGEPLRAMPAKEYYSLNEHLWSVVTRSLEKLLAKYDVVVIEGAGSPVEVNLKDRDLVNMKVATYAHAPVILLADIDRGGIFASIVGTLELLEPHERALVKALVINKFRGDLSLLTPGVTWLEERTGIPVAGVIPYYRDIHIAEEDSISLERRHEMKTNTEYVLDIAVLGFPHISNFDDFDPLEREEGVRLRYVEANDPLGTPDLVVLPGTKTTMADLDWLRERNLDRAILDLHHQGVPIIGICGGYQMLGESLWDPHHVESSKEEVKGLGLLPVTTRFETKKETHRIQGEVGEAPGILGECSSLPIEGYEIHMGNTAATSERVMAPFRIFKRRGQPVDQPEGAINVDGRVLGTYIHDLFYNSSLRRAILQHLAQNRGVSLPPSSDLYSRDEEYNRLASLVRSSLNMELVYQMAGLQPTSRVGP